MPSQETISSFYVFTAGSIARAEDVNANFANFRGHLIPIDPNTSTAATTKTYDLGSTEHKWNVGYFSKLDVSITSTAQMIVDGLSSGGWNFNINSLSVFKITDDGFIGANLTPMTVQNPTATVGNIAARSTQSTTITSSQHIANTTCTVQCLGRPVIVSLAGFGSTNQFIEARNLTSGANTITAGICFVVDGVVLPPHLMGTTNETSTRASAGGGPRYGGNAFFMVHAPAAGYHTYSLYVTIAADTILTMSEIRLSAREF